MTRPAGAARRCRRRSASRRTGSPARRIRPAWCSSSGADAARSAAVTDRYAGTDLSLPALTAFGPPLLRRHGAPRGAGRLRGVSLQLGRARARAASGARAGRGRARGAAGRCGAARAGVALPAVGRRRDWSFARIASCARGSACARRSSRSATRSCGARCSKRRSGWRASCASARRAPSPTAASVPTSRSTSAQTPTPSPAWTRTP